MSSKPVCRQEDFQLKQLSPPEWRQILGEEYGNVDNFLQRFLTQRFSSTWTFCDFQGFQLVFRRLALALVRAQDGGEAGRHSGLQCSMLSAHHSQVLALNSAVVWGRLHEGWSSAHAHDVTGLAKSLHLRLSFGQLYTWWQTGSSCRITGKHLQKNYLQTAQVIHGMLPPSPTVLQLLFSSSFSLSLLAISNKIIT